MVLCMGVFWGYVTLCVLVWLCVYMGGWVFGYACVYKYAFVFVGREKLSLSFYLCFILFFERGLSLKLELADLN